MLIHERNPFVKPKIVQLHFHTFPPFLRVQFVSLKCEDMMNVAAKFLQLDFGHSAIHNADD